MAEFCPFQSMSDPNSPKVTGLTYPLDVTRGILLLLSVCTAYYMVSVFQTRKILPYTALPLSRFMDYADPANCLF
jgi:hypothetical protein